jgi:hypothetical protein
MIATWLLNFFVSVITNLLNTLPDISASNPFVVAGTTLSTYTSAVYNFLPDTTVALIGIIAFDLIFETGYFSWKILNWILRRLPTQS